MAVTLVKLPANIHLPTIPGRESAVKNIVELTASVRSLGFVATTGEYRVGLGTQAKPSGTLDAETATVTGNYKMIGMQFMSCDYRTLSYPPWVSVVYISQTLT